MAKAKTKSRRSGATSTKRGATPRAPTKAAKAAAAKAVKSAAAAKGWETRRRNERREARAINKLIREQEAARAAAEQRDARAARKARRAELATERARKARKVATRPVQWEVALERMREIVGEIAGGASLRVDVAPHASKGQPWQVRAVIKPAAQLGYGALSEAFGEMAADPQIERYVDPRRYTRIAVTYTGPESRGSSREVTRPWTVAEIAPWETTISRAQEQTDPEAPDSPAARYYATGVKAIEVWISGSLASEVPF